MRICRDMVVMKNWAFSAAQKIIKIWIPRIRRTTKTWKHHSFQAGQALGIQAFLQRQKSLRWTLGLLQQWSILLWVHIHCHKEQRLKILERYGFDYELVEDLKGYVVSLPKSAKYAQILKNSVAQSETANERIFLLNDLAAVEEAVGLGAKIYERGSLF